MKVFLLMIIDGYKYHVQSIFLVIDLDLERASHIPACISTITSPSSLFTMHFNHGVEYPFRHNRSSYMVFRAALIRTFRDSPSSVGKVPFVRKRIMVSSKSLFLR